MEKTSIFLGSKGLSQSEANHTANVAKEIAEGIGHEISHMSLFKKMLHDTFGQTEYNFVKEVDDLETKCMEEGNIYALSAWLREGIKAKAAWLQEVMSASAESLGFPTDNAPAEASLLVLPTEAEMIDTLSIAERAEYLALEAKAAHIGKKIHPGGIIPRWRRDLAETPPVEFIQGTITHMRVSVDRLIDPVVVDALFYKLQKEHREVESRVNYYKAKLHNLFNEKLADVQRENSDIYEVYRTKLADYRARYEVNSRKAEAKRAEMLKEISDLKVIIPDSLQKTLDYVQTFSRK